MTIGAVVAWIGERSVWWLLALPPALWMLRGLRNRLWFLLWRRNMRRRIQQLEREIAAHKKMHHADAAAWCEWQRTELHDLLDAAWLHEVPQDEIDAYNRRWHALTDAYYLAKDQSFIAAAKAAWLEEFQPMDDQSGADA